MKVDNGTNTFAVYEDATEYYGTAEVTLPEIGTKTEEITGAGIGGAFNGPFVGQIEAMSFSMNFRRVSKDATKLAEPRNHQIDLRAAQQYWDNTAGKFKTQTLKHVLIAFPTKFNPGKLANASSADAACEFSVTYYAIFIDGEKTVEIDVLNCIYFINGIDYAADIRKALGK